MLGGEFAPIFENLVQSGLTVGLLQSGEVKTFNTKRSVICRQVCGLSKELCYIEKCVLAYSFMKVPGAATIPESAILIPEYTLTTLCGFYRKLWLAAAYPRE